MRASCLVNRLLGLQELLIASIEDVILLIGQEASVSGDLIQSKALDIFQDICLRSVRFDRNPIGRHDVFMEARLGGLLLQLGKDHATADSFGAGSGGLGLGGLFNDLLDRLNDRGGGRDDTLHLNIAPQSVANRDTVGKLETPVRDGGALTARGSKGHGEFSALSGTQRGSEFVALHGTADRLNARWVARVHVEHGVSADEADITASRPGKGAWVEESPGLAEDSVWRQLGTIGNSIANEVSLVAARVFLLDSLGCLNSGNWVVGSRPSWLGLGGLHLYGRLLDNDRLLLLDVLMQRSWGVDGDTRLVTQRNLTIGIVILGDSANSDGANGSLELDQGVGAVVLVIGMGLAARTEVNVVTDGTLVANTSDVALSRLVLAQRAITEDAKVDLRVTRLITNSFVDRGKAVSRVVLVGLLDARGAVVPVGARQALVADADDTLEEVSMCSARRQIYGLGSKSDLPSHIHRKWQRA